jgi:hypothetical protein
MSVADWPQTDPGLERAYRRLLRAYPSDYRRRHESEVVTTLLEMAEPGRRHPAAADAWHLVASGIRHRFRLPARRPFALMAAVLVMLIGGAAGAAAGSAAVELAFLPLPDPQTAATMHRMVSGAPTAELSRIEMDPDPSPWTTDEVGWTSEDPAWDVEAARLRLSAEGWHLGQVSTWPAKGLLEPGQRPITGWRFDADRDGVRLMVNSFTVAGDATTPTIGSVSTTVAAAGSAALMPAIMASGALGLITGWLAGAAAARRIRRLPTAAARSAVMASTGAILVLAIPVVALYGNVWRVFSAPEDSTRVWTVHSALRPGPYWPEWPVTLNAILAVTGLLLGVVALALSRVRSDKTVRLVSQSS